MVKIIAICNQKGGVGKSTTAVSLGSAFALASKRVLLVDLDPQGNATISSGAQCGRTGKTAFDVIAGKTPTQDAISASSIDKFDVIASCQELSDIDRQPSAEGQPETALKTALTSAQEQYDVVLLDCPPSLGFLTTNALVAADQALIPVQCEYLAMEGLNSLLKSIERIKQTMNPNLGVGGIVLTMADFRTGLTQEVSKEIRQFFGGLVFESVIPRNVRLAECPSFGKPIHLYDPTSSGAMAYSTLAQEVMNRMGMLSEAAK